MRCDKCKHDVELYGSYLLDYGRFLHSQELRVGNMRMTRNTFQMKGQSTVIICDKCLILCEIIRNSYWLIGFLILDLVFFSSYYVLQFDPLSLFCCGFLYNRCINRFILNRKSIF